MVEIDASRHGLGDVVLQAEHPIAYYRKFLGIRTRGKPIYEKELMDYFFCGGKMEALFAGASLRCTHRSMEPQVPFGIESGGPSIPKMG